MKPKEPKVYLKHILQECDFLINNALNLSNEAFVNDPILQRAFVRSLEVIGEAVKNLPKEFRDKHPQIPWKSIAGMRDVLIHEYFGVDYELVWKAVNESIPALKREVENLLKEKQEKAPGEGAEGG